MDKNTATVLFQGTSPVTLQLTGGFVNVAPGAVTQVTAKEARDLVQHGEFALCLTVEQTAARFQRSSQKIRNLKHGKRVRFVKFEDQTRVVIDPTAAKRLLKLPKMTDAEVLDELRDPPEEMPSV